MPLVEAAQRKIPIIARDINIFREVAGDHAFYFKGNETGEIATEIEDWLDLRARNSEPESSAMPWLTWAESTTALLWSLGLKRDGDKLK